MVASLAKPCLLRYSLGLRLTFKLAQSGKPSDSSYARIVAYKNATVYTDQQKQPHNPETGMVIIGGWTGTYFKKGTDGRIL